MRDTFRLNRVVSCGSPGCVAGKRMCTVKGVARFSGRRSCGTRENRVQSRSGTGHGAARPMQRPRRGSVNHEW
jgi:hypothetical protein